MTPDKDQHLEVTEDELATGFAAVMDSLDHLSPQEAADLDREADRAVLGHDAYLRGLEHLDRGDLPAAKQWLLTAARYQVPGAQETLDHAELRADSDTDWRHVVNLDASMRSASNDFSAPDSAAALCQDASELGTSAKDDVAPQIKAATRKEADELLAANGREADRTLADAREEVSRLHSSAPQESSALALACVLGATSLQRVSLPDTGEAAPAASHFGQHQRPGSWDGCRTVTGDDPAKVEVIVAAENVIQDLQSLLQKHGEHEWLWTGPAQIIELTSKLVQGVQSENLRNQTAAGRGRAFITRLERLDSFTVRMAWAAAVLGTSISPAIAATVAGLSAEEAANATDRLRETRILTGSDVLEFVHPVIATAVYRAMPDAVRLVLHGVAAQAIIDAGLGPSAAARHLVETRPDGDPWVVDQLRQAAREAMRAGMPEVARRCLARALHEPPSSEDQAAVLVEFESTMPGTTGTK
ncbi:hypothetical protein ACICHK_43585 (plasmid) [Streptomyces sp. AHU1]|uniref:hypothetical protein n=1 Tax=Streptomyces sp. AHU1 TaxID=3377215 RepID=UPI003877F783